MIVIKKSVCIKLLNNSYIVNENLLKNFETVMELDVDTIFELKQELNKIHLDLFKQELLLSNQETILTTSGVLTKDHPLYKEQAILDLVNAKSLNSDFEIEVELSVKKMDEDFETVEDFANEEELETYIKEIFFDLNIERCIGYQCRTGFKEIFKNGLLVEFCDFIQDNDNLTNEYKVDVLIGALQGCRSYIDIDKLNKLDC